MKLQDKTTLICAGSCITAHQILFVGGGLCSLNVGNKRSWFPLTNVCRSRGFIRLSCKYRLVCLTRLLLSILYIDVCCGLSHNHKFCNYKPHAVPQSCLFSVRKQSCLYIFKIPNPSQVTFINLTFSVQRLACGKIYIYDTNIFNIKFYINFYLN